MQLRLVRATGDTRQLDQIVDAFTPPMQRVCRHMTDAALQEMVRRMAMQQQLDDQRHCGTPPRRSHIRRPRSSRSFGTLHPC